MSDDPRSPSESIDARIDELGDWRGDTLADPTGLFDSSLEGNTRRAIDLHEGERLDRAARQAQGVTRIGANAFAQ